MTPRTSSAFSLHELLITITLISVAASFTLPALSSLKQKSQHEALRNALYTSLYNARAHAILHRRSVELCAASKNGSCSSDWQNGWQSRFLGSSQPPLDAHQSSLGTPLQWSGFSKTIRFYSNGTSTISNGRFFQCHNGSITWQLIINRQGRVRVTTASENDGQAHRCQ